MIVDPDFLEHWRTRMLVDALGGDEMAPFYVLRIWGHCQQRRGDRFAMPAAGLKALCKASGAAADLESALVNAGFVERDGADIYVPKWSEKNASLLAAWDNGNKGGRPRKEPKENPRVTQPEPTANPSETQTEPIRVEKRREEKNHTNPSGSARGTRLPSDWTPGDTGMAFAAQHGLTNGSAQAEFDKFRDHWAAKAGKDGVALDWQAKWRTWVRKSIEFGSRGPPQASKQSALEARNRAVIDEFMRETDGPH